MGQTELKFEMVEAVKLETVGAYGLPEESGRSWQTSIARSIWPYAVVASALIVTVAWMAALLVALRSAIDF